MEKFKIGSNFVEKERIDLISKHVLKTCNYFHPKNKNNNNSIKRGEGKLMITNGMTLSNFNKKYHFN